MAAARAERARMAKLRAYFRTVMDSLIADYATGDRGLEVREVAGGFRFATKPEYHDAVRGFVRSLKPPLKLSLQALETLAVIAYKQPISRSQVAAIRAVNVDSVVRTLLARGLVTEAFTDGETGAIHYGTTDHLLTQLGINSLDELPQLVNVLRGEMSLVGPRPALPSEVVRYDEDPRRRLAVKPGLTGLWQVSGRSDLSFEDAIRLDLYYVDNWSMLQDVIILLRTVNAVISSRGAY